MNWAIIMAGGYGERFWPKSRRKQPKQLLPIVGDKTMIQQTVERVRPLVGDARIVVVTNHEQVSLVRKQLPRVKHVIGEPIGRNTAPCIGLAAAIIGARDPDAVMAVLPADSYIRDTADYRRVVGDALKVAAAQDSSADHRDQANVAAHRVWLHSGGRGASGQMDDEILEGATVCRKAGPQDCGRISRQRRLSVERGDVRLVVPRDSGSISEVSADVVGGVFANSGNGGHENLRACPGPRIPEDGEDFGRLRHHGEGGQCRGRQR